MSSLDQSSGGTAHANCQARVRENSQQLLSEIDRVAFLEEKAGDTIIKYGEDIGEMKSDAKKGEHVHTHNLKTKKW